MSITSASAGGSGARAAPASRSLRDALAVEQGNVAAARTFATAYGTSRVCSEEWYCPREESAAASAVTGTGADPRTYIRIAAMLRERITAGDLAPGQATPSITRLCADHGVARQTASSRAAGPSRCRAGTACPRTRLPRLQRHLSRLPRSAFSS